MASDHLSGSVFLHCFPGFGRVRQAGLFTRELRARGSDCLSIAVAAPRHRDGMGMSTRCVRLAAILRGLVSRLPAAVASGEMALPKPFACPILGTSTPRDGETSILYVRMTRSLEFAVKL